MTSCQLVSDHLGLFPEVVLVALDDESSGIKCRLDITALLSNIASRRLFLGRQNRAFLDGVSLAFAVAAIEVRTRGAIGTGSRALFGCISTDTRFGADGACAGNDE
jgi:hypothetical protein